MIAGVWAKKFHYHKTNSFEAASIQSIQSIQHAE
jgi:hypothetical protein